jgi:hypothetical protein
MLVYKLSVLFNARFQREYAQDCYIIKSCIVCHIYTVPMLSVNCALIMAVQIQLTLWERISHIYKDCLSCVQKP